MQRRVKIGDYCGMQFNLKAPGHIVLIGLLAQLWLFVLVWQHTSENGVILGRFSRGYGIFVGLFIVTLCLWCGALIWQRRFSALLYAVPRQLLFPLIVFSGGGLVCWFTSIEITIKLFFSLNWLLFVLLLLPMIDVDQPVRLERWVILGVLLLLPIILIASLATQGYFPDEAGWAERARNLYWLGGAYKLTRLQEPFLITPGYGWFLAPYGWLLHHVAFSYHVGRVWIFVANLLGVIGVGLLTGRLYGRRAALISAGFAMLSLSVFPIYDFKANFQLKAIAPYIIFAAVQSRLSLHPTRYIWHGICGLLMFLAMQLHAAAIAYVLGLGVFYAGEYLVQVVQARKLVDVRPILAFGTGASIGLVIFIIFNVLSIGGFAVYLEHLSSNRFGNSTIDWSRFLQWPSLLERIIIFAALAYIIARRNQQDRLLLILLSLIIGFNFATDSFGYTATYQMLYFVPVGALLVTGIIRLAQPKACDLFVTGFSLALLLVLTLQLYSEFLSSNDVRATLRNGMLPEHVYVVMGEALDPILRPNDVIVSEPDLIWGLPSYRNRLYSYGLPTQEYEQMGYASEAAVWSEIAPTILVDTERIFYDVNLLNYLTSTNFRECERFPDLMTIYRPDCDGPVFNLDLRGVNQ